MSKFTNFLNLFKWDSVEDSEEEFDIDKALNDNWDKIDVKLETHINNVNTNLSNFEKTTNKNIEDFKTSVNKTVESLEESISATQDFHKYTITTESEIAENTDYEIPCNYKVGQDVLDIFYMGEKLIKGTHYIEVGTEDSISNKIQFYNWGQSVPTGRTIEFVVRGVYTSES